MSINEPDSQWAISIEEKVLICDKIVLHSVRVDSLVRLFQNRITASHTPYSNEACIDHIDDVLKVHEDGL